MESPMRKLVFGVAVVLFACCLATSSCFRSNKNKTPTIDKLRKDFDNLAIWLERNIASEQWEKLLEAVDQNVRTDAARRKCRLLNYECALIRAADIVSELSQTQQCNARTMDLVRYVAQGTYRAKSFSRSHILANGIVYEAIKTCPNYILQQFEGQKVPESASLDRAVEVLKPYTFETSQYEATLNLPVETWAKIIRLGGASDDRNIYGRTEERSTSIKWKKTVLKNNFAHIYKTYFLEPCKSYKGSQWGDFLESIDAMAYFNVMFGKIPLKPGYRFLKDLPLGLQDEIYKFYICNSLDRKVVQLNSIAEQLATEDQKYNHVKLA